MNINCNWRKHRALSERYITIPYFIHFKMPVTLRQLGNSRWRTDINVECRLVPMQRSQIKQLYKSNCWVTALQTSMFPWQQENTAVMEEMSSTRSVTTCYKQDQFAVVVSNFRVEVFEYLHISSGNRKRRRKGNQVPGGITGSHRSCVI
jgi:hypothetical protein